jgi:lysophospholipase L1-like esterase
MNILNSPGFASMSLVQQATAVQNGLTTIQSQYDALMNEIKNVLPNTKIDLIGAYNPFHATPNSPLAGIAEPAFLGLNNIIQSEASKFGASYIDTYTAFLGHESTYTNILSGSGTPTAAGYSAIANALGATVPEPSTAFAAGFGLVGLALWHRRNRRAA